MLRNRSRLTTPVLAALVAVALVTASLVAPALGAPRAISITSLAKRVAQALKIAKNADEKATTALKRTALLPPTSPATFGTKTGTAVAGDGSDCTVGEIMLTAGNVAHGIPANGQVLPINQNEALFTLLGTVYGGDGKTTFALPDLRAVTPNNMTYAICDRGVFPSLR